MKLDKEIEERRRLLQRIKGVSTLFFCTYDQQLRCFTLHVIDNYYNTTRDTRRMKMQKFVLITALQESFQQSRSILWYLYTTFRFYTCRYRISVFESLIGVTSQANIMLSGKIFHAFVLTYRTHKTSSVKWPSRLYVLNQQSFVRITITVTTQQASPRYPKLIMTVSRSINPSYLNQQLVEERENTTNDNIGLEYQKMDIQN